ncbi:Fe2+-dependent dioxygenase [Chitinimonas arctica]|uniref:Fe2+-dependent dioxygenase n=1 Tax=Chitinimonas arctica TaxID=2594795 RepID=A0A516SI19_9NEIS|nr:Fe2+-dependent dioxygenase [Chitinimonas arctica]QDQ27785.1 Fe2+-dependent dioxygenase [Chitinimonas arctica]
MLMHIPAVLDAPTVRHCRRLLDAAGWGDGRVTAGSQSSLVKRNQQLPHDDPATEEIGQIIRRALQGNGLFFSAALPKEIIRPLFNRYEGGQDFGNHVDNAVRGVPGTEIRVRTDLSATLFLSEPEEYDGGDLVIEDSYGLHAVKLAAGDMILYPATSLHRVEPVSRGTRLASFFWIQSMVRSAERRAMLFDLDQSIQTLRAKYGDTAEIVRVTGVYHNLLRQWVEL